MRIVHHVRNETARRTHIDFQPHEFPGISKAFAGLHKFEELEMHKAAFDLEAFQSPASVIAQLIRYFGKDVYDGFRVIVDGIGYIDAGK